jgi:hypothetical protein
MAFWFPQISGVAYRPLDRPATEFHDWAGRAKGYLTGNAKVL